MIILMLAGALVVCFASAKGGEEHHPADADPDSSGADTYRLNIGSSTDQGDWVRC